MSALDGVLVIDFGQYLAGPFGPMIMGDLGADVIKVEPVAGDGMRLAGKPFFGCQRGKHDIALDLKNPRGLEIALELIEQADIVHHNMTAGVANRLGIGYEDCKRVNPDVVYCNTWAYGLDGPLALRRSRSAVPSIGRARVRGRRDPHRERSALLPVRDVRRGQRDAQRGGFARRLYHQRVTGEGQELWTSLMDGGAVYSSDALLVNGEAVERPRLDHGLHGTDACYRLYETQDGWIQIAAVKESQWIALCGALGAPDLADDSRFAVADLRREHRHQLEALLAPRFLHRTSVSWSHALDDAGVPNEVPVDTHCGDLVLFDADNVALGMVAEYEHPMMGLMRQFGELVQFSDAPGAIGGPPPLVGEHTREILEWLGKDAGTIDALKADGVITWPGAEYPWVV